MQDTRTASDIVVYGATGDLAARKLFRSLYFLYCEGVIDEDSRIVGVARTPLTRAQFVERVEGALRKTVPRSDLFEGNVTRFIRLVDYRAVDERGSELGELAQLLPDPARTRVFFLAMSCARYVATCEGLSKAGLLTEQTRVVLEKPIGEDAASARAINVGVGRFVREDQIFRIDHYLGKETVQNLLALRFANVLFEPLWRAPLIDEVQISVSEDMTVEGRLDFYDRTGALRDMVQSHLLQLLCLVAMEVPHTLEAKSVREEKLKVLAALEPLEGESVDRNVVRGQYEGYGRPGSKAETFVALRVQVNNWRWAGVPFYLRTGKALDARQSRIIIKFKSVPQSIFPGQPTLKANRLILMLQPDDGKVLELMAKAPGQGLQLEPVQLKLDFLKGSDRRRPHSYERLIRDAVLGDSTLFLHRDEVDLAWKWIDPILARWDEHEGPLHAYAQGSPGPDAAANLFPGEQAWDDDVVSDE